MARVIGLGELLLDAHYVASGDTYTYSGSRGGGSVWNTLANAAVAGGDCLGIAEYAPDWRSELAKRDLEALGVDVEVRHARSSLPTPVMHHMPIQSRQTSSANKFRTSSNCPVCVSRTQVIDLDRTAGSFPVRDILGTARGEILVVDGLSRLRIEWAGALKARDWLTVADIGYSRFLRYMRRDDIRDRLSAFGLLVMQRASATFLAQRLEVPTIEDVAELLQLRIIVSDGGNGLTVYSETGATADRIEAPSVDVVDSVGAGDALLGNLLARISRLKSVSATSIEDMISNVSSAVTDLPNVLRAHGARGHLEVGTEVLEGLGPRVGQSLHEIRMTALEGICAMCGSGARNISRRTTTQSGSNSTKLSARVIAAASNAEAVASCRRLLDDRRPTVVCASGGSFPAARFIADTLNAAGSFATAMKPLDVLMTMPRAQRIIGVTYSGRSSDTFQAVAALHQRYGAEQALITRVPTEQSRQLKDDVQVIAYGMTGSGTKGRPERGFVAMAAAVSPAALWAAAAADSDSVRTILRDSDLPDLAGDAARNLVDHCALRDRALAVIGSGWATSALLDLESKIIEAGLGHVVVHEAKDFSHGRFMSVAGTRAISGGVLHVGVGSLGLYEVQLLQTLGNYIDIQSLMSHETGVLGALDVLHACQRFAVHYGRHQGVDISQPGEPPSDFLSLYRWTSGLGGEGSAVFDV